MKVLALMILLLASSSAFAGYGDIEPGKCYEARVFLYKLTKNLGKGAYEIRGLQVPDKYKLAIYETKAKVTGTGLIGGWIKLTGEREVSLESGFPAMVPVFGDCK